MVGVLGFERTEVRMGVITKKQRAFCVCEIIERERIKFWEREGVSGAESWSLFIEIERQRWKKKGGESKLRE